MPLVASRSLFKLSHHPGKWAIPAQLIAGRRIGGFKYISLQATPSTDTAKISVGSRSTVASSPDATFEVVGQPYSLLSVTLSPSQDLYTRRGTLVGLSSSGDANDTISTLRLLGPLRRGPLFIPFLYQRVTSTASVSALIAPKSSTTSFAILQLDGTTDWRIAQRKALLAWTGKTLQLNPTLNTSLSVAHWGNTDATGRGLLALAGQGQIFSLDLAPGETYTAHPSHILAYSTSSSQTSTATPQPKPYRFRSSALRFSIPLSLGNWFPRSNFVRNLQESGTYKFFHNILLRIRTWSRRTIRGDRLFLKFEGPTTILLQSRGASVREVLTGEQVNEIADAPAGAVNDVLYDIRKKDETPKRIVAQGVTAGSPPNTAEKLKATALYDRATCAFPAWDVCTDSAASGYDFTLPGEIESTLQKHHTQPLRQHISQNRQDRVVRRVAAALMYKYSPDRGRAKRESFEDYRH